MKAISGLGPKRSILGTIIRPDAALLERKGGPNGDTTFEELLPGSLDPIPLMGDYQELYCNWRLDDENDEPLPRNNPIFMNPDSESPAKKRKKSKEMKARKRTRENGDVDSIRHEKSGSRNEKSNHYRWRSHHRNGGYSNGYNNHPGRASSTSDGRNGNRYNHRQGRVASPWAQGRQTYVD